MTASVFPVVFFNGFADVDAGSVAITGTLDFERFRTIVSSKIGIPPHQISLSLIRRRRARTSPEVPRKEPIDEMTDFVKMSKERDCFVLAVIRRSRRGRSRGVKKPTAEIEPERKTILRRNGEISFPIFPVNGYMFPMATLQAALPECVECREGSALEFHRCVYDEVVDLGFRSTAGPIARPAKKQV